MTEWNYNTSALRMLELLEKPCDVQHLEIGKDCTEMEKAEAIDFCVAEFPVALPKLKDMLGIEKFTPRVINTPFGKRLIK